MNAFGVRTGSTDIVGITGAAAGDDGSSDAWAMTAGLSVSPADAGELVGVCVAVGVEGAANASHAAVAAMTPIEAATTMNLEEDLRGVARAASRAAAARAAD